MPPGEVDRAIRRARRRYASPQFRRTYVRGARAALAGLPPDACPYRRPRNRTWGDVWRDAWLNGYHSVARDAE